MRNDDVKKMSTNDATSNVVEKSATCHCASFHRHKWIIYSLLAISLSLHSTFIVDKIQVSLSNIYCDSKVIVSSEEDVVVDTKRSKRSVKGSNSRDYSDAQVEFIHPKLRDEMTLNEQQDPNNPWVWLTSYSRIPVSIQGGYTQCTAVLYKPFFLIMNSYFRNLSIYNSTIYIDFVNLRRLCHLHHRWKLVKNFFTFKIICFI